MKRLTIMLEGSVVALALYATLSFAVLADVLAGAIV